ncbi:AAA family ATPase [Flavobacterium sp. 245]|uniref:AAA family ATPase n=1 Tax=Flavobacterium sp. 245 TaxID=2512115 RepID=UPI00105B5B3B|nr:AAA family ATPase [Flavobacterium sp. 245]TDO98484.1 methyltransferase family protein [Flavobacterium sp. 245]
MRIKRLELNESDVEPLGLKSFYSTKFNTTIALIGKNGSGKSRYLKAIENKIRSIDLNSTISEEFDFISNPLLNIFSQNIKYREVYSAHKELQDLLVEKTINPKSVDIDAKIRTSQAKLNREHTKNPVNVDSFKIINKNISSEINNRLKIIKPEDLRALQQSFDSKDQTKVSFQSIVDSTLENIEIEEFSMITESALTYLQRLPHRLVIDDIETRGDEKKFKSRVAYKRFELLSSLIHEFLGKTLEWESRSTNIVEQDDSFNISGTGYWTINKREFNYEDFSSGEKVLFTYAILLFLLNTNPKIKFKESIIIIDEPELNLHPKAQIKLIQTLENLIKDEGQLIIATHSLSITANLDYSSIFLVRDDTLHSPSSSVPFNAVDDLMGFEEHYNKIVEFLVSTPSWAMTNFMAQCFEDPEVFDTANKNDPQLEIFKKLILENEQLNILDYGCGKGRLLDRIKESENTWNRIQKYDCFDIDINNNDLILSKGAHLIINEIENIEDNKYDIIIIVNVLHEIHIEAWQETLNTLKKALKPEGFLAIIEDLQLPIGELPNELGFLLLGKEELKTLLGNEIKFINPSIDKYKDRIICGIISTNDINSIDKKILISTLEKLKSNSLKEIIKYREQNTKNLSLGRMYALKANSYVNSQLAIDFLKKQK